MKETHVVHFSASKVSEAKLWVCQNSGGAMASGPTNTNATAALHSDFSCKPAGVQGYLCPYGQNLSGPSSLPPAASTPMM